MKVETCKGKSMKYTIENEYLTVEIDSHGAELQSIKDQEGTEYLWQGDGTYWKEKAPNLFPYIGRLTDGKYTVYGKEYHMGNHGFAKNSSFVMEDYENEKLTLSFNGSRSVWKEYPFQFVLYVSYKLEGPKLSVSYIVENKSYQTMYFGIGGHPGFNVPLENNLDFSDYYLEFEEVAPVKRLELSEDCFVTGGDAPFEMKEGKKLPLTHDLFDQDAIVLKDMCKKVTLKSDKSQKKVVVGYPNMDYLGIWHRPKTDAPYVCIEPWTSVPSRKDIVEDLAQKPDFIKLSARDFYVNTWWMEI